MSINSRISQIAQELKDDTHVAMITSEVSRHYLTGFPSSDGILVISREKSVFFIDARYYEKASEQITDCEVELLTDLLRQMYSFLEECGAKVISIESNSMTIKQYREYMDKLRSFKLDASEWLSKLIAGMRIVKTDEEIKLISAAQGIAEKAFSKLITVVRAGMSEKQVAALLNFYMLDFGADGISFDTIAASGINSACPHAVPTDKPIENGEFLTLDFGAVVKGYHSDMTRTVVIGKPTDEMKEVYNAVWGAHTDALKAVRAEITGKLVDNVARSTLDAWNYEEYFTHGLGHGVGLEIHEAPNLSPKSDGSLRDGMVVTIEPGVYIPHRFGVRIEDMVRVTADGCVNLTQTPKTLIYI